RRRERVRRRGWARRARSRDLARGSPHVERPCQRNRLPDLDLRPALAQPFQPLADPLDHRLRQRLELRRCGFGAHLLHERLELPRFGQSLPAREALQPGLLADRRRPLGELALVGAFIGEPLPSGLLPPTRAGDLPRVGPRVRDPERSRISTGRELPEHTPRKPELLFDYEVDEIVRQIVVVARRRVHLDVRMFGPRDEYAVPALARALECDVHGGSLPSFLVPRLSRLIAERWGNERNATR